MDLLDRLRREAGNAEEACREDAGGAQEGDAPPVLLARLYAPDGQAGRRSGGIRRATRAAPAKGAAHEGVSRGTFGRNRIRLRRLRGRA